MRSLRAFDVPGIDVIWSQITYPEAVKNDPHQFDFFPLIASSAARQCGHSKCLSESFAVYGSHVTPEEMRFGVNAQAVRGISLFNFMSITFDRSTAMSLQCRPNFQSGNLGMDCLGQINNYTARLSKILQESQADIHTALLRNATVTPFGENVDIPDEDDLFYLADACAEKENKPRLYTVVGTEDFLYEDNLRLRDKLAALPYDYTYVEAPGVHSWDFWDEHIQGVLRWMFEK
jgi:hypothetical protein